MSTLEKCEKWRFLGVGLVCGLFGSFAIKGRKNETPGTVVGGWVEK
jgi:hypothetical protein